jgi:hypothetical protein
MLTSGVVLQNNVHPHIAAHTPALWKHFNWELFDHPPYSPYLTLSDYHIYLPEEVVGITALKQ